LQKSCLISRASRPRDCICVEEAMKQFALGVVIAAGLTFPASAQSIKAQLVGTWRQVSCGGPALPLCAKLRPKGILIFDASGNYAAIYAPGGRPKVTGTPLDASPAEEIKAAYQGFVANFGTWTYNEADKTITYHREGAFFPNVEGTDVKSGTVSVTGDDLKFTGPKFENVLRRVSK
jgi:hypothetical protein